MLMLEISIDQELKVGYVKSGSSKFSRTIIINNEINIDLDVNEKVIGVEFLGFNCLNQSEESLSGMQASLKQEYVRAVLEAQEHLLVQLKNHRD